MHDTIEIAVGRVLIAYGDFAARLESEYAIALASVTPDTVRFAPRQNIQLPVDLHASKLDEVIRQAFEDVLVAHEQRARDEGLSPDPIDDVQAPLSELRSDVLTTLGDQLRRDARSLTGALLRFKQRVHLRQMTEGLATQNAMLSERESELRSVSLKFSDRLGRQWDSRVFMFVEMNRALYEAANLLTVETALANGYPNLLLEKPDGTTEIISLADWPDFLEEEIHPRSQWLASLASVTAE